jgi:hypothetical protein
VLRLVPFAYMPSLIPRQVVWNLFARRIPSASAFPRTGASRLLHHCFWGLLSVYLGYGLHARRVAFATLCTRGFSSLVASTAAPIATGWSEPVPGRGTAAVDQALFTAHPVSAFTRSCTQNTCNYRPRFGRADEL